MFRNGEYATIWEVKKNNNYSDCKISTSKKNKETGKYDVDFSDIVRFIGKAHKQCPKSGQRIKLLDTGAKSIYNKETQQKFRTYILYDYELAETPVAQFTKVEDDLPFIL